MFYLWDSVFTRDKKPLVQLFTKELGISTNLVTYTDFVLYTEEFIAHMHESVPELINIEDNFDGINF